MAGPIPRADVHQLLCDALTAMPVEYNNRDLRQLEVDAWHMARDPFGELGVEGLPAHLDHLGLAVEFGRGRRTGEQQRRGALGLALIQGTIYISFHYRAHEQLEDYRRAMDAAELAAATLEGGWHKGACTVQVDEDWNPRLLSGEPVLLTSISFTLQHERFV